MDGWSKSRFKDCLQQYAYSNKNDTGPHLFCVLHRIGSNSHSNLAVAPFCAKKYVHGWMGGWVGGWISGWLGGWVVEPG